MSQPVCIWSNTAQGCSRSNPPRDTPQLGLAACNGKASHPISTAVHTTARPTQRHCDDGLGKRLQRGVQLVLDQHVLHGLRTRADAGSSAAIPQPAPARRQAGPPTDRGTFTKRTRGTARIPHRQLTTGTYIKPATPGTERLSPSCSKATPSCNSYRPSPWSLPCCGRAGRWRRRCPCGAAAQWRR